MENKILNLKHELESFETRELLGKIANKFITFSNGSEAIAQTSDIFNKTELTLPFKQYAYLVGLLMSTTDNIRGIANNDPNKYKKLEDKVQEITHIHINNFFDYDEINKYGYF